MGRKIVLVVEDFEDTRLLLTIRVETMGYQVIEASNGREAIETVKRGCPDLILMDMSLPVVDGLEATRLIHQMERSCRVPVIAVTAHTAREYKEKAISAGCVDFIEKPIDFVLLESVMKRALNTGTFESNLNNHHHRL